MELRQAIGNRRSIRFLRPYQPVEPEKIQRMLEAARLASHWGNVGTLRAVVVVRDSAPAEVMEAITAPIAGYQVRLAPVIIVWFLDTAAIDSQAGQLRELLAVGALGVGEKKSDDLENQLLPIFESIQDLLKGPGINEVDCGQGIAQATLVAFEQGLGTCLLGSPSLEEVGQKLGLPDTCRTLLLQTVGYPAESAEAGGQRPRRPFEELFHLNGYGNPFPRSDEVLEELKHDGMIQQPAPLEYREAELEWLHKALDVPGSGLI